MKLPVYMDYHATTPLDPRVWKAMEACYLQHFGNASSRDHAYGRKAGELVETARSQVAAMIGARAEEIVFTGGATESDNMALMGAARMYKARGNHIISCVTEHKAVLDTLAALEEEGFKVTLLPVDARGWVDPGAVRSAITPETILISVMAANNEIGTIASLEGIGVIASKHDVPFHTDAAQAAGNIPLDVRTMHIDLLSLSAHKMCGPKGVGALYTRSRNPRVRLQPLLHGGGHEHGLRPGTLNVAGIVGLGEACRIAASEMQEDAARIRSLRDGLQEKLFKGLDNVHVHGHPQKRLPGNLSISFEYVEAEAFLEAVGRDMAVSSGAACTTAAKEPSHVLKALGVPERLASCAIRFGLGRFTTQAEVDYVADRVMAIVPQLRQASPLSMVANAQEKLR